MAMFWQYVKGLNQSSTDAPLYTFFDFKKGAINGENKLPNIVLSPENSINATDSKDFGHILTQGGTSSSSYATNTQTVYSALYLNPNALDGLTYRSAQLMFGTNTNGNDYAYITSNTNGLHITANDNHSIYFRNASTWNIEESVNTVYLNPLSEVYITPASHVWIGSASGHGAVPVDIRGNVNTYGYIHISEDCQALYFNATSDRRAKTDIQPLPINALDIVKKVQLYSFRYKDMDTPSIGIIAQDVQNININGFKLVDNENASGQDMDYMTIHESKLVYVLWKAIQEQQKEIDELKVELKKRG